VICPAPEIESLDMWLMMEQRAFSERGEKELEDFDSLETKR
jgi:hypothetical protein